MIIIKSQDGKRIKKCSDIQSQSTHIYGSGEIALNDQELVGESLLGIYKEGRAKKVMGMIEEHIEFLEHVKLFKTHQYFKGEVPETMIFEMPKE